MEDRLGMSLDQIITSKESNSNKGRGKNNGKRNVQANREGRTKRLGNPYSSNGNGRRTNFSPEGDDVPECAIKFLLSHGRAGSLIGNGYYFNCNYTK